MGEKKMGQESLPEKALVAMSGGVDSSVAALLLAESGVEVVGASFRLPFYGSAGEASDGKCCGTSGIEDARRVCRNIGAQHYALDYREKFEETVLKNFLREYLNGRTPNPCIRCNDWLKFGRLLETARAMDVPAVATGHYVKSALDAESGRYRLLTGPEGEDQSYFLFSLSQHQLAHALFPLGSLTKKEVRDKAREAGLKVHSKPKSQDLCFLPEGNYGELIKKYHPELLTPGDIYHLSGEKLGRHKGVVLYTTGQRKGLGIAWSEPLYVAEIDAAANRIIVGEKKHVWRNRITVSELNWICEIPPENDPFEAAVKIRFRHTAAPAKVNRRGETAVVEFENPQFAPAPGQAAVFYRGKDVLGGGFIRKERDELGV